MAKKLTSGCCFLPQQQRVPPAAKQTVVLHALQVWKGGRIYSIHALKRSAVKRSIALSGLHTPVAERDIGDATGVSHTNRDV